MKIKEYLYAMLITVAAGLLVLLWLLSAVGSVYGLIDSWNDPKLNPAGWVVLNFVFWIVSAVVLLGVGINGLAEEKSEKS